MLRSRVLCVLLLLALILAPVHSTFAGGDDNDDDPTPLVIERATIWLLDHQEADGSWSPDAYAKRGAANGRTGSAVNRDRSDASGPVSTTVRNTAMATLALIRAGAPANDVQRHAAAIANGLAWLVAHQLPSGQIATTDDYGANYDHCAAIIALADGLGHASDELRPKVRAALTSGVAYIADAQNIRGGQRYGWRFKVRPGDNSSLVTGWMLLALHHAAAAEVQVEAAMRNGGLSALIDLTGKTRDSDGREIWRTGYIQKGGGFAMTMSAMKGGYVTHDTGNAMHVIARHTIPGALVEEDEDAQEAVKSQVAGLLADAPSPEKSKRDYLYWFFGTVAMKAHADATAWTKWADAARTALFATQRTDGEATSACYGSWDTTQSWGAECGRVFDTAFNLVTLTMVGPETTAGADTDERQAEGTGERRHPSGSKEYKAFMDILKNVVPASHPALQAGSVSEAIDGLSGLHRTRLETFLNATIRRANGEQRDLLREFRRLVRAE